MEMKDRDILLEAGGIKDPGKADEVFKARLDKTQLERLDLIQHPDVRIKIANAIVLCDPKTVFIHTGTQEDREYVRKKAVEKGEEAPVAYRNHTIHYDLKDEQGRIIDRTFYIADPEDAVSSLAKRMDRNNAYDEVMKNMKGIMRPMEMIVGFYIRGPKGAPVSNPALEITSSTYVSHSADILYRNAYDGFDGEVARAGHFYTNVHSEGKNRAEDLPNARVFMDRKYQTTFSFNCTYAGNTLLLKKGNHRFSVDRSVYEKKEEELSEHMFITGMKGPGGRVTWFAGAAPSGCGKTTTAMAGDEFIGDDLAQMWIEKDGSVRGINPECGIFGIVEDVNWDGDPRLMEVIRDPDVEVIWSNVLIDENGIPRWTGDGDAAPVKGKNFQGEWEAGMKDEKGKPVPMSHPNSRCTVSAHDLKNVSDKLDAEEGVEIRVITYNGRDADTMPPVWVGKTTDHGVVIGACIVSAATATEVGATGVKRSPWANAPFIPGSLADYMDAQFRFFGSKKIAEEKRPIMAGLNYFLTDAARGGDSKKLLGEKRDVKVWMGWLERLVHGDVEAIETPVGRIPKYRDLNEMFSGILGKEYPEELYEKQFSLYIDNIVKRIDLQTGAYRTEENVPERLFEILDEQKKGLEELKKKHGPVVSPGMLE